MCFGVKDVCAVAFNVGCFACNLYAQMMLRDNLNGIMVFQNGNILVLPSMTADCLSLYRETP